MCNQPLPVPEKYPLVSEKKGISFHFPFSLPLPLPSSFFVSTVHISPLVFFFLSSFFFFFSPLFY
jgi:hypothetical protein